ncbi:LSM domain-containing protein [Verticillium alfalfae VaMs.102]|uniref:LSM domain-containing protein n=1 Tax=Verticillium alfalfae (strain VaMs.102 / ATCC MYA-4576 / FGSC 10136) TaxID=526221 RepID=C9SMI3_VERA1|nr:LSM domain-containing protein [Verticillium alfalfae VaMs.102]EEY19998.1 LSM domain-containing protein [Verticillium alfalfae VaMs.102]
MHRPASAFCLLPSAFTAFPSPRLCVSLSSRASLIHPTRPTPHHLTRHTPNPLANMENGNPSGPQGEGKDPSSFLSDIIGNAVTVKLNSGVVYKGAFCEERCKQRS